MTFPHSIVRACIHKNVDFLRNVCGVFWSLQNAYCGVSRCMPLSRAVYQRKVHAIQPVHTCPLIHDMTWSLLLRYSTYMYPLLLIHHYTACAMLLIRYTTCPLLCMHPYIIQPLLLRIRRMPTPPHTPIQRMDKASRTIHHLPTPPHTLIHRMGTPPYGCRLLLLQQESDS